MCRLGRVPRLNDEIIVDLAPVNASEDAPQLASFSMRVSEMDGRRIAWIDVTRQENAEAAPPREDASTKEPMDDNDRARRHDSALRRQLAEASQAADEATPGI